MRPAPGVARECAAEFIGTYVVVFFGTGSVHVAVLTGGLVGLWQVAVVWGAAISLAIYATSSVSGAHMNPAITVAFAAWRRFPSRKVPHYVASQLLGAVAAAATLYALFHNLIGQFEAAKGLVRGQPGSELSAMLYGEYFPNPALMGTTAAAFQGVSHLQAMLGEGLGTAFLAFFVFAVTDARNRNRPSGSFFALFIGLAVAIIIAVIAPLTQAGLNPARDFGPRLFACFAGWGGVAIPGPRGGFLTVYILAPCLGALAGSAVYELVVAPGFARAPAARDQAQQESVPMSQPRLILVGGFLGSGKTTLLAKAAERLAREGKRVGLITNDQATNLVDTGLLERQGLQVREVSGGCFCCRFDDLVSALKLILAGKPDVIIAEPVGSCTDLSATVLQPLKQLYGESFRLAPFSVLADPSRLREALADGAASQFPDSVLYIFRKQLEEADLIVINKCDTVSPAGLVELEAMARRHCPDTPVLALSALRGDGLDAWLGLMAEDRPAGRRIAEVDYDVYADGESVLGWLNASVALHAAGGTDWRAFTQRLMETLAGAFRAQSAEVAHLKMLLAAGEGSVLANLTGGGAAAVVRGSIPGSPGAAALTLNARVRTKPERLRRVIEESLRLSAGDHIGVSITSIQSFAPARPRPIHRFERAV